ncbi:hemerythrin domain-containing protein [Streptomyces sp. NPDC005125]
MGKKITGSADIRDMLVDHQAFITAYERAPGLVLAVREGEVSRANVVADHLALIGDFLHLHHKGEDDLLWPKIEKRAPASLRPTLGVLEDQHVEIDRLMTSVSELSERWRASARSVVGEQLADALQGLSRALVQHLALEEKEVLSSAHLYVTATEWHELGDHAINGLPKAKLPIIFGMLADIADPSVVKLMLESAPAVPRFIMPILGPRAYARHARRVYGS